MRSLRVPRKDEAIDKFDSYPKLNSAPRSRRPVAYDIPPPGDSIMSKIHPFLARVMLLLILLMTHTRAFSADTSLTPPAYPRWDNREAVSEYAARSGLPPARNLDLGDGVTMELVLIPPGQFMMGMPAPAPLDEHEFRQKIIIAQALLAAGAGVLLLVLLTAVTRAIRARRRPQLSLGRLMVLTIAAGGCVLSTLRWRQSMGDLDLAHAEYEAAMASYVYAGNRGMHSHAVILTEPFYMGKYDVTQQQYQQLAGSNPSYFKGINNPVETVSWDDAESFCKKLSELTHQPIRLPTEAEWEYALRAGTTTTYYSGNADADLLRIAWFQANSDGTTHAVGQKEPNKFGLYDMQGNVWQWCHDSFETDYYERSPAQNPQGPEPGANTARVIRGGSWLNTPLSFGAFRASNNLRDRRNRNGFRIVMPLVKAP